MRMKIEARSLVFRLTRGGFAGYLCRFTLATNSRGRVHGFIARAREDGTDKHITHRRLYNSVPEGLDELFLFVAAASEASTAEAAAR